MSWIFVKQASSFAAAWTPNDSPDTYAWWKADSLTGTYADGDQVNSWYDEISSYHLAREEGTAGFPKFVTNSLNSLPGVEFDGGGSGTRLYKAFSTTEWPTALTNLSHMIVVVFRTDVTSGTSQTAYWSGQGSIEVHRSAGKASATFWGTTFNTTAGATTLGTTTTHIAVGVWDYANGTRSIYLNGTLDGSSSGLSGGWASPSIRVGSNFGTQTFDGMIYETAFIHAIDTTTRQKLEGYLAHKWGLASNLPTGHPYENAAPTEAAP